MKKGIADAKRLVQNSRKAVERARANVLRARAISIRAVHLAEISKTTRYENHLIRGVKR